jgi:hypothetical protein
MIKFDINKGKSRGHIAGLRVDSKGRAHNLFLHGMMGYVNGKIDVFELCDRFIRIDSIIRKVPINTVRKERKHSLRAKINITSNKVELNNLQKIMQVAHRLSQRISSFMLPFRSIMSMINPNHRWKIQN